MTRACFFVTVCSVKEAGSEVMEEDHVPGSYMGDELDLETVGDIISIIEEKVHGVCVWGAGEFERVGYSF